jgi:hypothetical protein
MSFLRAGRILFLAGAVLPIASLAAASEIAINGRPASDLEGATSVVVDPQTGSVFVAGWRQFQSDGTRFFVAKFTVAGEKEWQEVVRGTADLGLSGRSVVPGAAALQQRCSNQTERNDGTAAVLQGPLSIRPTRSSSRPGD